MNSGKYKVLTFLKLIFRLNFFRARLKRAGDDFQGYIFVQLDETFITYRNENAYSCSNFSSLKILRFTFLMNKILIQERACSKRITFGLEVFTE